MSGAASRGKRWGVVAPAMVLPLVFSYFYFVLWPGTALGNGLYLTMKVLLVIWPLAATAWILREPIEFRLGGKQVPRGRQAIAGVALGGVILVAMGVLMLSPLGEVVRAGAGRIRARVEGLGVMEHFLLYTLFVSVLHSLIEEVYWRWFVFGNLYRLVRPSAAHGLAALAFTAHHVVVLTQFFPLGPALFFSVGVAVGGLLWSWLLVRQGSLLAAWISHLLVDFGLMTIGAYLLGLL